MELTRFTDYALRTLIFAGVERDRLLTVPEVASAFRISEHHLVKVIHHLGQKGWLETRRGRGGGFRLSGDPAEIRIGAVVRETEPLALVECLHESGGDCPIDRACVLKRALREAREAFLDHLDEYTLADLLQPRDALGRILLSPSA